MEFCEYEAVEPEETLLIEGVLEDEIDRQLEEEEARIAKEEEEEEENLNNCAPNLTEEEQQLIKKQEANKKQVIIPIVQDGDEFEEEEEEDGEPALVHEVEYKNGVPYYQNNHLLMDENNHFKCVVYERIGYDDAVGATYLVLAHDKELILRVEKEDASTVAMEHAFIKKVEEGNKWLYFSQFHSQWTQDGCNFLMLYYRPGPSFLQIRQFMHFKVLSYGTGARLALDILKSIHVAHSVGKLIGSLEYDMFHFDAAGRSLFMSDISHLQEKSSEKARWIGSAIYAPVHQGSLRLKDNIQSWFFMFCETIRGDLPWKNSAENDVDEVKRNTVLDGSLLAGLPQLFKDLYTFIDALPEDHITEEMYQRMEKYCVDIYTEIGEVKDLDDNLDFERDPNEAELPRFVLEKRPIEQPEGEADDAVKITEVE